MYLIRVGNLTISLEHLILVEDARDEPEPRTLPPGLYRMTLETGRVLDLEGDRADCARELVDEVAIRRGGEGPDRGYRSRSQAADVNRGPALAAKR